MIFSDLYLGTALWGWTINKAAAFSLLDNFVDFGGIYVDTATNYPINSNPSASGLALSWIREWTNLNHSKKIKVLVKVGSIDNLGSPETMLSYSYLHSSFSDLHKLLKDSLYGISIHWDNRPPSECGQIKETLLALSEIQSQGLKVGLSGIKYPELYYDPDIIDENSYIIQCRENLLYEYDLLRYKKTFINSDYIAYGINIGGLKIDESYNPNSSYSARGKIIPNKVNKKLIAFLAKNKNFDLYKLNIANILINTSYSGFIIGSSNNRQLSQVFEIINWLNRNIEFIESLSFKNEISELKKQLIY